MKQKQLVEELSTLELGVITEAIISDLNYYTNVVNDCPVYEKEHAIHKVKVLNEAIELKRYDNVDVVAALNTLYQTYNKNKEMEDRHNVILSAISKIKNKIK